MPIINNETIYIFKAFSILQRKIVMNVKAKWICILKYASARETTTGHSALQFFAFEINDQRLI